MGGGHQSRRHRAPRGRREAEALEERYWLLHENMRDPFVKVAMDGHIECNELFCELVGYSRSELQATAYVELTPAQLRDGSRHRSRADPGPVATPICMRRNSLKWMARRCQSNCVPSSHRSARAVHDPCGRPSVTSARRAADALHASEERLQQAMQAATAGVWQSTPATGEFWASVEAIVLLGLPQDMPLSSRKVLRPCTLTDAR